jgi:hypothetical protein
MNNIFKAALAAAVCLTMVNCSTQKNENASADYIGPSDIKAENGLMSPEVMLNLGRLSDPQLSPDGAWILYGVSYTSIEQNRMCRNLFLTPVSKASDGSLSFGEKVQLTKEGSSVSNARWSNDGKNIYYIQKGQVWKAAFDGSGLSGAKKITEWPAGISEFKLSPDESMILFTSTVPGTVKTPKDFDPKLDKAQAYVTEDLMYRHWDHWTTERPQAYFAKLDAVVDSTKAKMYLEMMQVSTSFRSSRSAELSSFAGARTTNILHIHARKWLRERNMLSRPIRKFICLTRLPARLQ